MSVLSLLVLVEEVDGNLFYLFRSSSSCWLMAFSNLRKIILLMILSALSNCNVAILVHLTGFPKTTNYKSFFATATKMFPSGLPSYN